MQLFQVILSVFSCCAVLLCLYTIDSLFKNSVCQCTVVLTGESVKIVGCEFTSEFIEYAKTLKVQAI
uniref:Movement protein TGBp3 n=1 Tax=Alfalfa latent virus TaxID=165250 RepID=Q913Z6_9VIRU|nr:TBG3 [Alfalfa latent virus]